MSWHHSILQLSAVALPLRKLAVAFKRLRLHIKIRIKIIVN